MQREILPIERLRLAQIALHPRCRSEHVQWTGGVFLLASVSRDRQGLLAPLSDFARVPPAEGEASESRRRADDETDVVLLPRDGPALLERLPSRLLVEIPEREDARAVEGSRPGDGPRPRSGRREGLRQPRSRFFRVPAFLLEQPQVRRELERVGSSAVIEEPGKRGPERLVFLLETLHPGRVGRPPQVRLRLRCDCEKPFGAVCLLSVPLHVVPASEWSDVTSTFPVEQRPDYRDPAEGWRFKRIITWHRRKNLLTSSARFGPGESPRFVHPPGIPKY